MQNTCFCRWLWYQLLVRYFCLFSLDRALSIGNSCVKISLYAKITTSITNYLLNIYHETLPIVARQKNLLNQLIVTQLHCHKNCLSILIKLPINRQWCLQQNRIFWIRYVWHTTDKCNIKWHHVNKKRTMIASQVISTIRNNFKSAYDTAHKYVLQCLTDTLSLLSIFYAS